MHQALRADDCVDRAGRQAAGAANACFRVDPGEARRCLHAVLGIERQGFAIQQDGKRTDERGTARWTLIDLRAAGGYGLRVRQAARVATARALGLRQ